ncbi:magnesium transporter MgtE N-terminal domain-containing protein [Marinobacterium aestuariivivens]|uniref:Magnesium transporter MgtE N-terminal domain-containing protein n=1 Tax=Marinobacterium aestuariivivens TaxID=1698799 RepID=A0ABW2A3K7_9GAMM
MSDLLATRFMDDHPEAAAAALAGLAATDLAELFAGIPERTVVRVLQHLPPLTTARCLETLPTDRGAGLLARLPTGLAVSLLQVLAPDVRDGLLQAMPPGINRALRLVRSFPEGSVGAAMDTRVRTLPSNLGVDEALRRLRQGPQPPHHLVFVLDDAHRLVGQVAVQDLVARAPRLSVGSLLQSDVAHFLPRTPLRAIEHHPIWTRDTLVAVTDRRGLLLGVLSQARMVSTLTAESDAKVSPANPMLDLIDLFWSTAATLLIPARHDPATKDGQHDD